MVSYGPSNTSLLELAFNLPPRSMATHLANLASDLSHLVIRGQPGLLRFGEIASLWPPVLLSSCSLSGGGQKHGQLADPRQSAMP